MEYKDLIVCPNSELQFYIGNLKLLRNQKVIYLMYRIYFNNIGKRTTVMLLGKKNCNLN